MPPLRRLRALAFWLALGLTLSLASIALPLFLARLLAPSLAGSPLSSPLRLPQTPDDWPDPDITWRKGIPGAETLTSMRGIGVEHMMIVERSRAGWPLPALEGWLYYEYAYDLSTRVTTTLRRDQGGLAFRFGAQLPTRPLPAGVLLNILAWTIAPFLTLRAPAILRSALRRRRGLCHACGYPAGPSPRCSECGLARADH